MNDGALLPILRLVRVVVGVDDLRQRRGKGVREGSPAEKGQLKEGDRIVELNGKTVKNLETYMVLMARHVKEQPVELVR